MIITKSEHVPQNMHAHPLKLICMESLTNSWPLLCDLIKFGTEEHKHSLNINLDR